MWCWWAVNVYTGDRCPDAVAGVSDMWRRRRRSLAAPPLTPQLISLCRCKYSLDLCWFLIVSEARMGGGGWGGREGRESALLLPPRPTPHQKLPLLAKDQFHMLWTKLKMKSCVKIKLLRYSCCMLFFFFFFSWFGVGGGRHVQCIKGYFQCVIEYLQCIRGACLVHKETQSLLNENHTIHNGTCSVHKEIH